MKKLLIMMVALAVAFSAGAWSRNLDKGVLLLASKTLTPKAQRTLTNYVGPDEISADFAGNEKAQMLFSAYPAARYGAENEPCDADISKLEELI